MDVLVIAEHDNSTLRPVTLNTISAATALGRVTVLVAGHECQSVGDTLATYEGVARVLVCDDLVYKDSLAEPTAKMIARIAGEYTHLLAPASTFGKNLMPRLAALIDVAQISEIIEIIDADTFKRPIYAGNAIATVRSIDPVKVLTVRTTAFEAVVTGEATAPIESFAAAGEDSHSTFISRKLTGSERPELTAARVVVSGGRGLGSAENFALLEALADKLGAALGASRAAVDAGFVPNDYQVGQTGKVVAPEIYFAIGISGAIQHLAGMKDSKVIVAINKDENSPIFEIADYGLVADLFDAIPQLTEALA